MDENSDIVTYLEDGTDEILIIPASTAGARKPLYLSKGDKTNPIILKYENIKKDLKKVLDDLADEISKYTLLAGLATGKDDGTINERSVTRALFQGVYAASTLKSSIKNLFRTGRNIEKIYKAVTDKLEQRLEFTHWTIIKEQFEKAFLLIQQRDALKPSIISIAVSLSEKMQKDTLDNRLQKYPADKFPRSSLMNDLFEIFLNYKIFQDTNRDINSKKFSELIFDNLNYLTHNFLGKDSISIKPRPTELFQILFVIYRLDSKGANLKNKISENTLDKLKSECYQRIKKFFFDNEFSEQYVSEFYQKDGGTKRIYKGTKYFELEFELAWAIWYAYAEWYSTKDPSITKDMFSQNSKFRTLLSSKNVLNLFLGKSYDTIKSRTPLLTRFKWGNHFSKKIVGLMSIRMMFLQISSGPSTHPGIHAIDNAIQMLDIYDDQRYPLNSETHNNYQGILESFYINPDMVEYLESKGFSKIFTTKLSEAIALGGNFHFSAKSYERSHPYDYMRSSRFYRRVNVGGKDIDREAKQDKANELIDNGKITWIKPDGSGLSQIKKLIQFAKSFDTKLKAQLIPIFTQDDGHAIVADAAANQLANEFVGSEIPLYRKNGVKLVTGHLDILLLIDGVLYVCDYKPDGSPDPYTSKISYSFLDSIPQVAAYSKIFRLAYGIKINEIKCVTFNKDGAWVYDDIVLKDVEEFMDTQSISDNNNWQDYIY